MSARSADFGVIGCNLVRATGAGETSQKDDRVSSRVTSTRQGGECRSLGDRKRSTRLSAGGCQGSPVRSCFLEQKHEAVGPQLALLGARGTGLRLIVSKPPVGLDHDAASRDHGKLVGRSQITVLRHGNLLRRSPGSVHALIQGGQQLHLPHIPKGFAGREPLHRWPKSHDCREASDIRKRHIAAEATLDAAHLALRPPEWGGHLSHGQAGVVTSQSLLMSTFSQ